MKRKVITLVTAITLMLSTNIYANQTSLTNQELINRVSDLEKALFYLDDSEVIKNYYTNSGQKLIGDITQPVTRLEFAILMIDALELEKVEYAEVPFLDIDNLDSELLPYIYTCYENNIIRGKAINGKVYFGVNDVLTKEEIITILGRYANFISDVELNFNDADEVSVWARKHVSYFYNNDLVPLDSNGMINPKDSVTKEELIKSLYSVKLLLKSQIDNGYIVSNYVGNGSIGYYNENYQNSMFTAIGDIEVTKNGEVLISDIMANQIRKAGNDTVDTIVGTHTQKTFSGLPLGGYVDGNVKKAVLDKPLNILYLPSQKSLIFTQEGYNIIRGYNFEKQTVYTLTGNVDNGYKNGPSSEALFNNPTGMATDHNGNVYIADTLNHVIRKIDSNLEVTLFAGVPEQFGNELGDVNVAKFNEPTNIAIDKNGVMYVADSGNNMIKKIENGKVTLLAGAETPLNQETLTMYGGDMDGKAEKAIFKYPMGLAVDNNGIIYVADTENNKIKIIKDGKVETIAGNGEYSNITGNALNSSFAHPTALEFLDDKLLVADSYNYSIKVIEKK